MRRDCILILRERKQLLQVTSSLYALKILTLPYHISVVSANLEPESTLCLHENMLPGILQGHLLSAVLCPKQTRIPTSSFLFYHTSGTVENGTQAHLVALLPPFRGYIFSFAEEKAGKYEPFKTHGVFKELK